MKNLGLRSQGFIAVLMPLLIELIMVSFIIFLIFQSQADLRTVSLQRVVTSDLHRFIWETVDSIFQMHSNSDTYGLIDADTTTKERARFEKSLTAIVDRKWDPEQQSHVDDLRQVSMDLLSTLAWVQTEQSKGRKHWLNVDNQCFEQVNSRTLVFVESARAILVIEENKLVKEQARLRNSAKSMETALTLAIPGGLLVSIFFVWFYAVGMLKLLNKTMKNGELLSQRKPLLASSDGSDELSQLDRLIHSVSDAVEESFSREQAMFENTIDLICAVDSELLFTKANRAVDRMFGITQEDVKRQPILDFVIPADIQIVERELQESRSSAQTNTFDLHMQPIDRSTVFDTRWSVFWSENQQQYFCVIHDTSEEKNIARMKQDFLDMVSQDLLNPLMSMHGSIALIAQGNKGPVSDRMKKDMATAQSNINALENFVGDLLDFQQLQSATVELNITEFDLGDVAQKAYQLVKEFAAAKEVEVKLPHGVFTISGDERMLLRAVLNLLSNAIKFSPVGTAVSVGIQQDLVSTVLSITDSGPGVGSADREQIFEAFKQSKDEHTKGGTGLGLAIAKLAVTRQGGTIGVRDAAQGSGSTFWLSLPSGERERM